MHPEPRGGWSDADRDARDPAAAFERLRWTCCEGRSWDADGRVSCVFELSL